MQTAFGFRSSAPAAGALVFFVLWVAYFRGLLLPGPGLRDRPILKAFRESGPLRYVIVAVLRSPALLAAVFVYTLALRLFGVEASFLQMLGVLPVIFFGASASASCSTTSSSSSTPRSACSSWAARTASSSAPTRRAKRRPDQRRRARQNAQARSVIETSVDATSAQPIRK